VSQPTSTRRLHWGSGHVIADGWINTDLRPIRGTDVCADIRVGLPLKNMSIDIVSSQHALQELTITEIMHALEEIHRVMKPGGVARFCLPDFDKLVEAYLAGGDELQKCWDWRDRSGNYISQIIYNNMTRTPLTYGWTAELMGYAGFEDVRESAHGVTHGPFPEIVELDSRPDESFYIEGFK
jgi:predicted SAM-dependent methyltransferase